MLPADDMVYRMRRIRIVFMNEAVPASMRGAFCDGSPLRFAYVICQVAYADGPAL